MLSTIGKVTVLTELTVTFLSFSFNVLALFDFVSLVGFADHVVVDQQVTLYA